MKERMPKKCAKKPKMLAKVCKAYVKDIEEWSADDCDAWANAMGQKCTLSMPCKLGTMKKKTECEG